MDIDITDLVRDYLIRYTDWLRKETGLDLFDENQQTVSSGTVVDEFLKEDQ